MVLIPKNFWIRRTDCCTRLGLKPGGGGSSPFDIVQIKLNETTDSSPPNKTVFLAQVLEDGTYYVEVKAGALTTGGQAEIIKEISAFKRVSGVLEKVNGEDVLYFNDQSPGMPFVTVQVINVGDNLFVELFGTPLTPITWGINVTIEKLN